jgi:hypothetical protein
MVRVSARKVRVKGYLSFFHVSLYSLYDTWPGTLANSIRMLFAYLVAGGSGEQRIYLWRIVDIVMQQLRGKKEVSRTQMHMLHNIEWEGQTEKRGRETEGDSREDIGGGGNTDEGVD